MLPYRLFVGIAWTMSTTLVAGSTSDGEIDHAPRIHRAPGLSDVQTMALLDRTLEKAPLARRTKVIQNSTSIAKSWKDATLLSIQTASHLGSSPLDANVSITCKSCYATGTITTSLIFSDYYDATRGIESVTNGVQPITRTMTQNVVNLIESNFQNMSGAVMQDIQSVSEGSLGVEMLPFPTLPFDFSPAIAPIQDITVRHQLDGLELFTQLETSVSKGATYEMNLFTTKSQAPLRISDSLFLGVSGKLDLILDTQSVMNMTNGFHVRFGDGIVMEMKLFANTPPHVTLKGGQFEFLPVVISTDSAAVSATIRLGLHTGFIYENLNVSVFGQNFSLQAGIESGAFANLATFTTNVFKGGKNCDLQAVESYKFGVGAAAGANLRAGTQIWSPAPSPMSNILSIMPESVCASRASLTTAAPAASSNNKAQQALVTTTISSSKVFVGQACLSSGLVNCPVSLQTTATFSTMLTLVTALPSGVTPTFPQTMLNSVVSTTAFGTKAKDLSPSETAKVNSNGSVIDSSTGGVSNRVILGVSIGLGVPLLLAFVALAYVCRRRRRAGHDSLHTSPPSTPSSGSRPRTSNNGTTLFNYSSDPLGFPGDNSIHKTSNVTVSVERNYGFR